MQGKLKQTAREISRCKGVTWEHMAESLKSIFML